MHSWLLVGLAILSLILIPFGPQLLRIRIRILRWLNWNWAVHVLEDHFPAWVLSLRILLLIIAVVLLYFGGLR